jgi:hypothetical protein
LRCPFKAHNNERLPSNGEEGGKIKARQTVTGRGKILTMYTPSDICIQVETKEAERNNALYTMKNIALKVFYHKCRNSSRRVKRSYMETTQPGFDGVQIDHSSLLIASHRKILDMAPYYVHPPAEGEEFVLRNL